MIKMIEVNGIAVPDYRYMTVHEVEEYIRERSFENEKRAKASTQVKLNKRIDDLKE